MRYDSGRKTRYSGHSRILAKVIRKIASPYYIVPLLVIMLIVFHDAIKSLLLLTATVSLGAFSVFYRRFVYFNLGFELITFFTVIICFAYNPLVGAVSAIIMLVLAAVITGKIHIHLLIRIMVYTFLCIIVAFMLGGSIITAGKAITIIMNMMFFVVYFFMYGFNPIDLFSILSNIIINFILFSRFAEYVLLLF